MRRPRNYCPSRRLDIMRQCWARYSPDARVSHRRSRGRRWVRAGRRTALIARHDAGSGHPCGYDVRRHGDRRRRCSVSGRSAAFGRSGSDACLMGAGFCAGYVSAMRSWRGRSSARRTCCSSSHGPLSVPRMNRISPCLPSLRTSLVNFVEYCTTTFNACAIRIR